MELTKDIVAPARHPGEQQAEFRIRREAANRAIRLYIKNGIPFWDSSTGTYRKAST